MKPSTTQIGGDHYKSLPIQPMQLSMANGLNACQHTAIKYLMRYKAKGGKIDLEKAIHTIQLLIEFEYGGENEGCKDSENKSTSEPLNMFTLLTMLKNNPNKFSGPYLEMLRDAVNVALFAISNK